MLSIYDLVKNLSLKGVLSDMTDLANTAGLTTTAWQPGEPILGVFDVFSNLITNVWNSPLVKAVAAPFLDFAEGSWLKLTAWAHYGVLPNEGAFATGFVTLTNTGDGFYDFTPGQMRVRASAINKTYVNTTGGTLTPWGGSPDPYPTLNLTFQAEEIGSASTVASTDIDELVTVFSGVTVSNAGPLVGVDEESEKSLKERARLEPAKLSPNGAKGVHEALARGAKREDGSPVNINRVRVLQSDVNGGMLVVYLASPSGAATAEDVAAADESIQKFGVPTGLACDVLSASEHPITFGYTVYVDANANVSTDAIKAAISAAIVAFFRELPIGGNRLSVGGTGYVFADELKAKISECHPAIYAVTTAFTDATMEADEVATFTGFSSETVTQVAQ